MIETEANLKSMSLYCGTIYNLIQKLKIKSLSMLTYKMAQTILRKQRLFWYIHINIYHIVFNATMDDLVNKQTGVANCESELRLSNRCIM